MAGTSPSGSVTLPTVRARAPPPPPPPAAFLLARHSRLPLLRRAVPQPLLPPPRTSDEAEAAVLRHPPAAALAHAAAAGASRLARHAARAGDVPGTDEHLHRSGRAPWLRAMVLGANDGLVSTAALLAGVGAASKDLQTLRLTGTAGLIAGALSMAVGEYVSVASQRDAEAADVHKEVLEQLKGPEARAHELAELAAIYEARGVPPELARAVAVALSEHDVVRAHARDELGIDVDELARPTQAAVVSFLTFSFGAAIPLLAASFISNDLARALVTLAATTVGLLVFGLLGAYLGGAGLLRGGARVLVGGWLALGITYGIGAAFGTEAG
jgi:VIT1/CCC1 family predicted Fe2+/Mn2+ transporter